ncbi:2-dehydro-3-deoxyphosphogluconate aldolase/(4S)-4-hydroxy-2-oxoglutarate aldolase [Trueperella bonasi]|uniref:2-dehydro-3-deoxyphosphogluconate aldolase/(4S)-4-hydroxy-2-oxoglutarate aldolase n=1 Tax=Trueperella bonasi TaxID=312286 RepID=A0ABT9NH30_9ACTO|nr:bifunctional 4-hydroxy-2-oxoglutarate aldolase/2-dehydro-3-deoxy-phosphogluconate aldolase [Trueperella bonasi]MDP9806308.1 2-dehydro-3-deoxyphosphogluconate aldolase/(4S)-4-hydroxy-2-oxoglutarate aldolase [Trueperella bonasi]
MLISIIRLRNMRVPNELIEALIEGGIKHVEVTVPTPGAYDTIAAWSASSDVLMGAGTVRHAPDARAAADAGAKFFVTPTIDDDVLAIAHEAGIDVYCGAMTPTEIEAAYRYPAVKGVKVFPAGPLGGPSYLKAVMDPIADIPLYPTGGVDATNVAAYRALGCAGVGIGGSIVSEALVAAGEWSEITGRARAIVDVWNEAGA